jgi:hypothetical protein
LDILQKGWTPLPGGKGVLVIGNRNPVVCCMGFSRHDQSHLSLSPHYKKYKVPGSGFSADIRKKIIRIIQVSFKP